jgi:hypothetical protein
MEPFNPNDLTADQLLKSMRVASAEIVRHQGLQIAFTVTLPYYLESLRKFQDELTSW